MSQPRSRDHYLRGWMVRVLAGEVARGARRRGPCRPAFERTGGLPRNGPFAKCEVDGPRERTMHRGRVKTRRHFVNDRAEQDFSRFFRL
jgi:hypothetical protein